MKSLLITVFFFIRTDCPISNSYAPEIERLANSFHESGIDFHLIFPDRALTTKQITRYCQEYGLTVPVQPDPDRLFTRRAQVRSTPEVGVFLNGGLVYHGRIDNRYAALGKKRPAATEHDLEQVLNALLRGQPPAFASHPAIGCAINDLP